MGARNASIRTMAEIKQHEDASQYGPDLNHPCDGPASRTRSQASTKATKQGKFGGNYEQGQDNGNIHVKESEDNQPTEMEPTQKLAEQLSALILSNQVDQRHVRANTPWIALPEKFSGSANELNGG